MTIQLLEQMQTVWTYLLGGACIVLGAGECCRRITTNEVHIHFRVFAVSDREYTVGDELVFGVVCHWGQTNGTRQSLEDIPELMATE